MTPGHTSIMVRTLRDIMARKGKKHADLVHPGCALRKVQRHLPQRAGVKAREIPGATLDTILCLLGVTHAKFYSALAKQARDEATR